MEQTKEQTEKKRGGYLSALVILILVPNSLLALSLLFVLIRTGVEDGSFAGSSRGEYMIVLAISALLHILIIGFLVAILRWKRWGVYGFIPTALVAIIMPELYAWGTPSFMPPLPVRIILVLVAVIVLVILLRPAWKYME